MIINYKDSFNKSTMFTISAAILFLCFFPATLQNASVETVSANRSCPSFETDCGLGCCPFADAVCCIDRFECCQHGELCVPWPISMCIGPHNKTEELSLVSEKPTHVKTSGPHCPHGYTACYEMCCPIEDAVCCDDKEHCCPCGFICDVPGRQCKKQNQTENRSEINGIFRDKPPGKPIKKTSYKPCPAEGRFCPSYMNCCIDDDGEWTCCPKLPSPLRYGRGQCCETLMGYKCCPDDIPYCTQLGCF